MNHSLIAQYGQLIQTLHHELTQAIQDLPVEVLDWVPGPEMNSIAVLLVHTTGSIRYWVGDVAMGEPSGRVREAEFATRGLPAEELQRRLDAMLEYLNSALPRLTTASLEQESGLQRDGKPVSRGWAVLHALEHGYLHLGHIQLTARLWKQQHAG